MSEQSTPSASAPKPSFQLLPMPDIDFSVFGPVQTVPLSRYQKVTAQVLTRNAVTIPHVLHCDSADVTALQALSKQAEPRNGVKMTLLPALIKASVSALQAFPRFNASLDSSGANLILKSYYHVGVAVDSPQGLLVPVLRDCDKKSIWGLAEELSALAAKARDKGLSIAEMSGGCFSISSLGGLGGTAFSPIINAPEVAILGVVRTTVTPVWDGNAFVPRTMLPLCLSYDHRVINGADAARFVAHIAGQLTALGSQPEHS